MRAGLIRRWVIAACIAAGAAVSGAAQAVELSRDVSELYTSVSIYPPSNGSMTVCYGFVCRRRHILDGYSSDCVRRSFAPAW